jgi:hypothetical protein
MESGHPGMVSPMVLNPAPSSAPPVGQMIDMLGMGGVPGMGGGAEGSGGSPLARYAEEGGSRAPRPRRSMGTAGMATAVSFCLPGDEGATLISAATGAPNRARGTGAASG